jgi:hypothetical protein
MASFQGASPELEQLFENIRGFCRQYIGLVAGMEYDHWRHDAFLNTLNIHKSESVKSLTARFLPLSLGASLLSIRLSALPRLRLCGRWRSPFFLDDRGISRSQAYCLNRKVKPFGPVRRIRFCRCISGHSASLKDNVSTPFDSITLLVLN